jgi:hypothetical protein
LGSCRAATCRRRFAAWSANLNDVIQSNQDDSTTFFQGLNAYSDLSYAEFSDSVLMTHRSAATKEAPPAHLMRPSGAGKKGRKLMQSTLPLTVDWRAKGKVGDAGQLHVLLPHIVHHPVG